MKRHCFVRGAGTFGAATLLALTGCDFIDPCRSQCELAAGGCVERPIEEFSNLDATRANWTGDLEGADCSAGFPFLLVGTCSDSGLRFLYRGTGFTTETHFFDPNTKEFVALRTGTDVVSEPCLGRSFWPARVQCAGGTVDEVICGSSFSAGQPIELP